MKYPKINGTELFGSATQDGFVELAGLDSNSDHKITSQDTAWTELKVWQDSNQDGIAQSGERMRWWDAVNDADYGQTEGRVA
ncbi:MAG: hypothetical protein PHH47_11690 [Gallionella sp.]|nr:hypothetical protein [Gallionella sp.]MDD4946392.1 hypothetical protein [Gallionella sp.]MDD5613040.1 hypothetical protein [Gallionella sp.]